MSPPPPGATEGARGQPQHHGTDMDPPPPSTRSHRSSQEPVPFSLGDMGGTLRGPAPAAFVPIQRCFAVLCGCDWEGHRAQGRGERVPQTPVMPLCRCERCHRGPLRVPMPRALGLVPALRSSGQALPAATSSGSRREAGPSRALPPGTGTGVPAHPALGCTEPPPPGFCSGHPWVQWSNLAQGLYAAL